MAGPSPIPDCGHRTPAYVPDGLGEVLRLNVCTSFRPCPQEAQGKKGEAKTPGPSGMPPTIFVKGCLSYFFIFSVKSEISRTTIYAKPAALALSRQRTWSAVRRPFSDLHSINKALPSWGKIIKSGAPLWDNLTLRHFPGPTGEMGLWRIYSIPFASSQSWHAFRTSDSLYFVFIPIYKALPALVRGGHSLAIPGHKPGWAGRVNFYESIFIDSFPNPPAIYFFSIGPEFRDYTIDCTNSRSPNYLPCSVGNPITKKGINPLQTVRSL